MNWRFMIRSFLLASALSLHLYAEPLDYGIEEIKDASNLPILNPDLAERKTAKLRLINGLEVLLISDPGADQSAAAISVEVGSWDDPKQYPGMAHFCEHMLFMGSHTYPSENEFSKMIADYNGHTNAFTASDRTVYMFSCKTEGFLAILDRFSHFFIDPLFNPSGISSELHAVDQEYAKNLENDTWREHMVFKELGNPQHPNRGFNMGNSQTLKGIPQESLKSWHRKHYGANRMHLAIYSPLPLDELLPTVSNFFSSVPTMRRLTKPEEERITSDAQRGHITYIKPVKNRSTLSLIWELPLEFSDDPAKSADLLAYSLNRGQKNSLYEKLKAEQLIDSLSIYVDDLGGKEHRFFQICLELTEKGIKQLDTSVLRCFEALAAHRSSGIPSYLFEEKNAQAKLFYQYQSRQDAFQFTMKTSDTLVDEPLETYPRGNLLSDVYDPEKTEKLIDFLSPESCVFSLLAPPELTGAILTHKEKWLGAEYAVANIPSEWLSLWSDAKENAAIRIAPPNPFVVSQLS
ncbi:MAG: insulinase family protein, partial [Chlamydiae bacterium]|nr:insulinase family protein [Chlamydiota bacterium]